MGVFEHFPYTNFHDLNLDKILERTHAAEEAAAASAADAAASAADAQAAANDAATADANATLALNTANAAASTANSAFSYSQAKATHEFEIIIDDQNSTITVTDCADGTVLTPLAAWQLCNKLFGLELTGPQYALLSDPALVEYPEAVEWPNIKIVNAYQPIYVSQATVAFNKNHFSLTWLNPGSTPALKTLTCTLNNSFTYANCTIV